MEGVTLAVISFFLPYLCKHSCHDPFFPLQNVAQFAFKWYVLFLPHALVWTPSWNVPHLSMLQKAIISPAQGVDRVIPPWLCNQHFYYTTVSVLLEKWFFLIELQLVKKWHILTRGFSKPTLDNFPLPPKGLIGSVESNASTNHTNDAAVFWTSLDGIF